MNSLILEVLWNTIDYKSGAAFEFKRIDIECIPELNIGLNNQLNRCLILELPINHNVDFQKSIKQNLTLEFFDKSSYIIIQLIDSSFKDLFNDFIFSVYQRIKHISEVDKYSYEIVNTFYKWSEFFVDKKADKLTNEIVKGIFGELLILKSLIKDSSSTNINDILNSWRGPFDEVHDFVFDSFEIEIKTKSTSKNILRIASEYQLEIELGKTLELSIISLEFDTINGLSLKDIIFEIKDLIIFKMGDPLILIKAINQKGLTFKNIKEYDNLRFRPVSKITYDCCNPNFPKLIKSNLQIEISSVSYNINITSLTNFIISEEIF